MDMHDSDLIFSFKLYTSTVDKYTYLHAYALVNPRHACAARVTVIVSLCVYVIPLQLTSQLLVRLTNNMTYSVGNENHLNETISFEKAPLLRSEH